MLLDRINNLSIVNAPLVANMQKSVENLVVSMEGVPFQQQLDYSGNCLNGGLLIRYWKPEITVIR